MSFAIKIGPRALQRYHPHESCDFDMGLGLGAARAVRRRIS
jgi:hypothetical protein